jgi:hypothetical protein
MPSSGSFLDPCELLEQIGGISYNVYDIPPICSSNSDVSKKLPDDGRLLPKHVGACTLDKEVIKFSA